MAGKFLSCTTSPCTGPLRVASQDRTELHQTSCTNRKPGSCDSLPGIGWCRGCRSWCRCSLDGAL